MRMFLGPLVCLAATFYLIARTEAAEESPLAQYYGFKPVEVFKLADRSGNMLTGDLNHDGLTDMILVDNSHSRLDLMIQRKAPPTAKDKPAGQLTYVTAY